MVIRKQNYSVQNIAALIEFDFRRVFADSLILKIPVMSNRKTGRGLGLFPLAKLRCYAEQTQVAVSQTVHLILRIVSF